ncbi:uncharacterized [Tachysurus ichikawai]
MNEQGDEWVSQLRSSCVEPKRGKDEKQHLAEPKSAHIMKAELSPAAGQTCRVQDRDCTSKLAEGTTLGRLEQGEWL